MQGRQGWVWALCVSLKCEVQSSKPEESMWVSFKRYFSQVAGVVSAMGSDDGVQQARAWIRFIQVDRRPCPFQQVELCGAVCCKELCEILMEIG